jgi:raffinose/stachyose/melibiose transport system substrate-binding protein
MSDKKQQDGKAISRREFLRMAGIGVAGLAALPLLSSCGPSGTPTQAPATATSVPVEPTAAPAVKIVWWTEAAEESVQNALVDLFVTPFNETHPGIELDMLFEAQLIDKVKTAVAGGGGPDIIETGGPTTNIEFYNAGYVIPLDDFADQYGWRDIMHPWAIANGMTRDHLISVQLTQETMMMVYNKGLLEEKGWQLPTGPEEFAALAADCIAEDIVPYASFHGWPLYHSVIWNDYSSALSVYKWLTGEIPFTSEEFVNGAEYWKMMLDKNWLGDKVWDMAFGDEWALLSTGKALMKMDGSWAFNTGADAFQNFDWDVAALPNLRDGITHTWEIGSGEALSISADCQHPEAAGEVLNFVYSDPHRAGEIIAAHPGEWVVPIRLSEADIPASLDPRQRQVILWMNEAGAENKIGYLTWSSWPPLTLGVSMDLADKQASGDISSEDFCAQIQTQFEEEFAAGSVLEVPPTYGA